MPSAPADARGTELGDILRAHIRRDGPIPVDEYMRVCLSHPRHGYWRQAGNIGAGGDFITAPEISQIFGELIGLWCAAVWDAMGRPSPLRLVELGPGRGTLMRDCLRATERIAGLHDALGIHLVEMSPPLREAQRRMLATSRRGHDLEWHDTLGEVPAGPAIVIANEFLDALPIRQLAFTDGAWRERVIDVAPSGDLQFTLGAAVDCPEDMAAPPGDGAILELRAGEDDVIATLAGRQAPVVALFIDYGPAEHALGDTLQAVRRHAYADPLRCPGSADLTAHVRFAAFARRARRAGLGVDGPMAQAEFLGRLGAVERTARLMAANPARAGEIEAATQRLMSPAGMGGLFKAMALRSPALSPPPPFV